jgi:hypothetical protein
LKVTIHIEPLDPDSEKLYVHQGDATYENADPFTTLMVLSPLRPGECFIHGAHGSLSEDINEAIGMALIEKGYHAAEFEARTGLTVTRWAKPLHQEGRFTRYRIDLMEAAECIAQSKT